MSTGFDAVQFRNPYPAYWSYQYAKNLVLIEILQLISDPLHLMIQQVFINSLDY